MSYEKAWSGDWHGRIPLAHELGSGDIAGAQIQALLLEEAIRSNTVPHLLRDLFVRGLRHRLPQDWSSPTAPTIRSSSLSSIGV